MKRRIDEVKMRRVVVTGMGIVSSIGNNTQEVLASLREAKSGVSFADDYANLGFRCQVHGAPSLDPSAIVDRRAMRFHGGGTAWNHVAMDQAILDAGLEEKDISNEKTGIIMGSGGPSTRTIVEAADTTRQKGPKRVGPFAVPKAMSSTASATLATWFKIKGVNYSISSACATSNHCIGNAYETVQAGRQDIIFAGGCEDLDWTLSVLFDAITIPYAPAVKMHIRSPRATGGRGRSFAKRSPVSQIGPTMSQGSRPGRSISRLRSFGSCIGATCVGQMKWKLSYIAGRIRWFMPVSRMTNFFAPPVLMYWMRESSTPAFPAMVLPGSRITCPPPALNSRSMGTIRAA